MNHSSLFKLNMIMKTTLMICHMDLTQLKMLPLQLKVNSNSLKNIKIRKFKISLMDQVKTSSRLEAKIWIMD